jgi:hypothetical protein
LEKDCAILYKDVSENPNNSIKSKKEKSFYRDERNVKSKIETDEFKIIFEKTF